LTQEFFARLLAKDYLSVVRREKGRFRWFLLCAVKRFLINAHQRAWAAKRGGGAVHVAFDGEMAEGRYWLEAADQRTPDKLFDRAWAVAVIERVQSKAINKERSSWTPILSELGANSATTTSCSTSIGVRSHSALHQHGLP
jgi:hypothetical protein